MKPLAAAFGRPTAAIILAAGLGARFGGRKLIASYLDRPLLQRAVDAACASRALSCVLVLGADADAVMDRVDMRRCIIVRNEGWRGGIASSIRKGLACARDADAAVFLLGDQPAVTSGDIDALLDRADLGGPSIVALRAGRTWGAPVLFPRQDFAALARLKGDAGAKRYAQSQAHRLRFVAARDRRAFDDVDTPADLRALAVAHAR